MDHLRNSSVVPRSAGPAFGGRVDIANRPERLPAGLPISPSPASVDTRTHENKRLQDQAANRRLNKRHIAAEQQQKGAAAKAQQARQFARSMSNAAQVRKAASRIVATGEMPHLPDGVRENVSCHDIVNQYLALTEALDYLSRPPVDVDDVFHQAMLLPVAGSPQNARELSIKLSQARDASELGELLADFEGLEQDQEKLFAELKDIRGSQKELLDYLRRAQGLDHPPGRKRFEGSVEELYEGLLEAEAAALAGDDLAVGNFLQKKHKLRGSREELAREVKKHRQSPNQLAAFVNSRLPGAASAEQDRIALRDEVADELAELRLKWGDVIETSLDAEEVAVRSTVPQEFVKSYSAMLFEAPNFAHAATQMLEKFGIDDLPENVGLMTGAMSQMQTSLESQVLQKFGVDTVPENVGQMGDALGGLTRRLDLMKRELGDTMREPGPDMNKLHATVTALSYMHILSTLIEAVTNYVDGMTRLARAGGIDPRPLDATELVKGLIGIVSSSASWLQPNQFENLLKKVGVPENELAGSLHTVVEMLRNMHEKAFVDNHARNTALDGGLAAMTLAAQREDEALDAAEREAALAASPAASAAA
jgi:hypothetical protein